MRAGVGVQLSIAQLAVELGCSRETVRKRLAAAGVKPDGELRGNPTWRLRDALQAYLAADGQADPARLPPFQRKAHFLAAREEIRYLAECRELVSRVEMETELARIFKALALCLDTLPDILERDCRLSGEAIERVESRLDELRESLALRLIDGDASGQAAGGAGPG